MKVKRSDITNPAKDGRDPYDYAEIESSAEFESISKDADVVLAVSMDGKDFAVLYGTKLLDQIKSGGIAQPSRIIWFAVDFNCNREHGLDLEHLCWAVRLCKGSIDYLFFPKAGQQSNTDWTGDNAFFQEVRSKFIELFNSELNALNEVLKRLPPASETNFEFQWKMFGKAFELMRDLAMKRIQNGESVGKIAAGFNDPNIDGSDIELLVLADTDAKLQRWYLNTLAP